MSAPKRGYLNSDFRLFHLTDIPQQEFEYHYHEFDKIIIFLSGNVSYIIEGRAYQLKPYDIVLVPHNHIHRPLIDTSVPYERIIVYLSSGFIESCKTDTYDLSSCFRRVRENHSDVLRIHNMAVSRLFQTIKNLEHACQSDGYANELYCQVLFLEFMICLNRSMRGTNLEYLTPPSAGKTVQDILAYISAHLTEPMDVGQIAAAFHMSRYYMMHLFKRETGYTILNYINSKRLLMAKELLAGDTPITDICYECGFQNYSSFSRIYKETFQETPRETRTKLHKNLQ